MYLVKYCNPKYGLLNKIKDAWVTPSTIFYSKKLIRMKDIEEEVINKIAKSLEGFSAREIEKFVIACHDEAFSKEDPVLDI